MVIMVSNGLFVVPISNVRVSSILLLPFIGSQNLRNLSGIQWYDLNIKCNQNQFNVFELKYEDRQNDGHTEARPERWTNMTFTI
jgi:hypothetical protein